MSNGKSNKNSTRIPRWWMGGVAAAGACCLTQSLDTIKVHQQTQLETKKSTIEITKHIIQEDGLKGLHRGLTAAILRQLTYSTFRFAFYEKVKEHYGSTKNMPFYKKIGIAALAGTIGGFIGVPADLINVRMQNDIKLPVEQRRNYKHVFEGLIRIYRNEGFKELFAGATISSIRSGLTTVGQLAFYDITKVKLMNWGCKDNLPTHFYASLIAGAAGTILTQPFDVIKTIRMKAEPGEFKNMWAVVEYTAKGGPSAFFKGLILRYSRFAPHTILTFVFFEQLRLNFGVIRYVGSFVDHDTS